MKNVSWAFVFALATLGMAGSGNQAASNIAWEPDFESALQKAVKEDKSIFVAFIMDNEPANDETTSKHYHDPDVVAWSAKMVCLIANAGKHAEPGNPCPKFGGVTCEQHQAVEKKARAKWIKGDVVRAPQHVFCSSGGTELLRKVYLISPAELKKAMSVAVTGHASTDAITVDAEEKAKVDQCLKDLESKNAEVRQKACEGLAESEDPRALKALLEKAKAGNQDIDRFMAIRALGKKGNFAAIKPLLALLKDQNVKVVIQAVSALGGIELPDPVPDLLAMLKKEKNDRILGQAVRAAAKCLPESDEVRKTLLGTLKGASARLEASTMLASYQLKPHASIVAAMKPLLDSKNANTRGLAAWVIGKQRDASCIPLLEKMSKQDKAPEVKEVAEKALAYCKGNGEDSNYDGLSWHFISLEELDGDF